MSFELIQDPEVLFLEPRRRELECPEKFVMFISSAPFFVLGIMALAMFELHPDPCIGSDNNIGFEYGIWLKIYGAVMVSISLVPLLLYAIRCKYLIVVRVRIIGLAIHFSLFILGSILYFNTVLGQCFSDTPIRSFGLTLFFIDGIVWLAVIGSLVLMITRQ
jgi:hypothetical protein